MNLNLTAGCFFLVPASGYPELLSVSPGTRDWKPPLQTLSYGLLWLCNSLWPEIWEAVAISYWRGNEKVSIGISVQETVSVLEAGMYISIFLFYMERTAFQDKFM